MNGNAREKVGPWTLQGKLGSGGNATVWRATGRLDEAVALKILNTHRAGREPYHRFVREIDFLRSLDDSAGVLPLVDAYLPETPTKEDRPWLAMPIATPIAEALGGQPLETVVSAVAEIAARSRCSVGAGRRKARPASRTRPARSWHAALRDGAHTSVANGLGLCEGERLSASGVERRGKSRAARR
jgi:hypothetical protein